MRSRSRVENWTVKAVDHIVVVVEESRERLVAMGVVVAHRLASDLGALGSIGTRGEAQVVHRDEDPSLRRLQAVSGIGQCPADDDTHRVRQVAVF